MSNKLLYPFVIIFMVILSSCAENNDKIDPLAVIDSISCDPPCWRGITPGETTFDEAWVMVQQMSEADDINAVVPLSILKQDRYPRIGLDFDPTWVWLNSDAGGIIKETVFSFRLFNKREKPKLVDILSVYGEPDNIDICLDVYEITRAIVMIQYPNIELVFIRKLPVEGERFPIPIQENTRIDSITLLSKSYESPVYDFSFSWPGYGDVVIDLTERNTDADEFTPGSGCGDIRKD